jgi:hypothetical protein
MREDKKEVLAGLFRPDETEDGDSEYEFKHDLQTEAPKSANLKKPRRLDSRIWIIGLIIIILVLVVLALLVGFWVFL